MLVIYGAGSIFLYAMLFLNEDRVLDWLGRGGWYALIPVVAALAFSFVHGAFTGHFWDALGIRAKQKKPAREEPDR